MDMTMLQPEPSNIGRVLNATVIDRLEKLNRVRRWLLTLGCRVLDERLTSEALADQAQIRIAHDPGLSVTPLFAAAERKTWRPLGQTGRRWFLQISGVTVTWEDR